VTGDFGLTALEIARQCGIVTAGVPVDDATILKRFPSVNDKFNEKARSPAITLSGSELMALNEHSGISSASTRKLSSGEPPQSRNCGLFASSKHERRL
jgi:magnesium-transporting ATPase (P-type)